MHDYLLSIIIVVLFSLMGWLVLKKVIEKHKRRQKYSILASLFLTILIISELMKEGFAAVGSWATISLVVGVGFLYLVKKFYKNKSILFHESPKMLGLAASYAVAVDLGQAIAILLSLHYIPQGGLFSLKYGIRELGREQFKFLILGIIAFVIISSLSVIVKAHIMTFAAGMILFVVIEEGFLLRR
jgi:hypothetical protein